MNQEKTNQKKLPVWLLILAGVLMVVIIFEVIALSHGRNRDPQGGSSSTKAQQTTQNGEEATEELTEKHTDDMTRPTGSGNGDEENHESDATQTPTENEEESTVQDNTVPTIPVSDPYEERLAASMVVGISMQYMDFEFVGIYAASETTVDDHLGSAGAYVIFRAEGRELALRSLPIEAERQEKGTADLYLPSIGYATYDLVDPNSVNTSAMRELQLEDLEEMIMQATLVSIIER